MVTEAFHIGSTPALLIGEKIEKVFLYVHGLHGRKEEALAFAEVALSKGYQVMGIDLPVERKPWEVLPLLNEIRDYLYENWQSVSVRANVINPITSWDTPTYILRPEIDMIVSEEVGRDFISQHQCQITIMPDGEHWFHTPEQLAFLKAWEEKTIISIE